LCVKTFEYISFDQTFLIIAVKNIFNRSPNRNGVEKVICPDKEDEDPHNNALPSEAKVKPSDDHNRPLKKRKLDASEIFLGNELKNDEGKSTDAVGHQTPLQSGSASENKFRNKNLNESPRGERGPFLKPEEKLMELSRGKLDEVSYHQSPQKDDKNNYEALQAPLPIDVVSSQLDICRLSIYCLFMLQQIYFCGLICQGVLLLHLRNLHSI